MPEAPGQAGLELAFRASLALGLTCGVGAVLAWVVGADGPGGHTTLGATVVLATLAVGLVVVAFVVLQARGQVAHAAARDEAGPAQ